MKQSRWGGIATTKIKIKIETIPKIPNDGEAVITETRHKGT